MAVVLKSLIGTVVLPGSGSDTYTAEANAETKNVQQQDVVVQCETGTGVVSLTLPEISSFEGIQNVKVKLVDIDGNAATNNVTIISGGSDTINGSAQLVVNTDNAVVDLSIVAETEWAALT